MISPFSYSSNHHNCAFRRSSPLTTAAIVIAVGACAMLAAAGCSSASSKSAGKGTDASSSKSTAAAKSLQLASDETQQVNSLTAALTVHSTGIGAGKLTGNVKLQLKPSTIIQATFNVAQAKSATIQLGEILTSKAVYFKDPAFAKAAGKPWVTANLSHLSSSVGVSLGSLLQNLESSDPLDQAKLFTASKNAHVVGTATLHGVKTTEYAGTYLPKDALAGLTPKLRKLMGPTLKSIGVNPVQFEVWVDASHLIRQAQDTDNVHGQIVTTKLEVTSVNKAVHIKLPPAGQVAPLPKI
jgi:hypothetical protein